MKVREIIEKNKGNYDELEINKFTDKSRRIHSDFIENLDEVMAIEQLYETEAATFEIMDEEEYANTINANSSVITDFAEWFGNKDAKVLVIMFPEDFDEDEFESFEEIEM